MSEAVEDEPTNVVYLPGNTAATSSLLAMTEVFDAGWLLADIASYYIRSEESQAFLDAVESNGGIVDWELIDLAPKALLVARITNSDDMAYIHAGQDYSCTDFNFERYGRRVLIRSKLATTPRGERHLLMLPDEFAVLSCTETPGQVRKFQPGELGVTIAAEKALAANGQSPGEFFDRHLALDQGESVDSDHAINVDGAANKRPVLSVYETNDGERIWVHSDHDHSHTTIMLPSEW